MPNRILKESICTSESLNQLSWFEQVFFDHLIVNCDDYGRMDARPAVLKAKLFPLCDTVSLKDIESGLQSLVRVGCVQPYEAGGKPYLFLPSWEKHQTRRAHKSKYPDPAGSNPPDHENNCKQMHADDSNCKQMSPYSRYEIRDTGYENGNESENEFENEKHPVAPQGADASEEKPENQAKESAEQSESLTVETARGAGKKKPADHSTTSGRQKQFEEFWCHYPRRVGRGTAEKAFDKLRPDKALFERILSAVDRQKKSEDWQRDGGRYIPYPATWLNGKRWEDDLGADGPGAPAEESGAPPGGKQAELPEEIALAKQQHEDAMKRFSAGKGSWEDLVPG